MSTEGSVVFEELKAALKRAEGTLLDCRVEAGRLEGQSKELLDRRGEALLKLARHYLPEISRAAIESTFKEIRSDLLGILAKREAKRHELQAHLDQANEEIERQNAGIDDVTRQLDEKVVLREKLRAEVAEILKGNADFQERSRLAHQAEEQLHRDEQRVSDMARESLEKLPHYEQSRLFQYLYRRRFGTSDYKAKGWVRSIDRWVSGLIDYPNARNGYEFLKKTPELVAAEVARRREQFEELKAQVDAIEKAEADKIGLTAVLEEGAEIGLERDRLVGELEGLQKRARDVQKAIAEVDQAQNRFYDQAIERFRAFLGETRLAVLQNRARQTPETEDDAIVAELAQLDEQIDAIGPRRANLAERRKVADRVKDALDDVVRKYRLAEYDSYRSYFEDFDVTWQVQRLEDGARDADDLWRSIESAQRFRPIHVETNAWGNDQVTGGSIFDVVGEAVRLATAQNAQHQSNVSFPSFPTFPSSGSNDAPSYSPPSYSAPDPTPSYSAPAPEPYSPPNEGGFTSGGGF
jgi:hypothetical protein